LITPDTAGGINRRRAMNTWTRKLVELYTGLLALHGDAARPLAWGAETKAATDAAPKSPQPKRARSGFGAEPIAARLA
jgi:hypothetical protein